MNKIKQAIYKAMTGYCNGFRKNELSAFQSLLTLLLTLDSVAESFNQKKGKENGQECKVHKKYFR